MHIQNLKIKNFKSLTSEEVDLRGRTVFLIGPNEAGKSSFIQAAFGNMPGEPLKEGESKGSVSIQLADKNGIQYTCTFKYSKTNQKPTLTIQDSEGKTVNKPATVFSELFNVTDFDVDGFLKLSGTKQVDAIKNLIGISWDDIDAEAKKLFDERTFKKRTVDESDKKLLGTIYNKSMEPELPIEEIEEKINKASKQNELVLRGELARKGHEDNIEASKNEMNRISKEIERLINLALQEEEKSFTIIQDLDKVNAWLSKNEKVDTEALQLELKAANDHNQKVAENNKVKALKEASEGLWFEINDIEKRLNEIKELKAREFRQAQDNGLIPVKGLSIDYEENVLRLDGFPFNSDQVNTARRIIAGLEIQAALMSKGQVRIAKFEGSLLDSKNMSAVLAWAKEKDIQLFIEQVSRDKEGLTIEVVEE